MTDGYGGAWLRVTATSVDVHLRVVPRASRNRIAGLAGDRLRVQVSAPPVEGAANEAVLELVADAAGVSKRFVSLVSGSTGRSKTVRIETAEPQKICEKLCAAAAVVR